jgi:O-antigen/teichoic acid export membrane protein
MSTTSGARVPPAPANTRGPEVDLQTRRNGVGRDIAITVLAQAAVGVGGLLLYRLLSTQKGAEGLASYALVKQLIVFGAPVVMLGMQTAIPRYVALVRDRGGAAESHLLAALTITGLTTAALSAAALADPRATASLLFGDPDLDELVVPLAATLAATVLLDVVYGYFRGRADFRIGNTLRVITIAVSPVILLLVAGGESIATLIVLMAVVVIAGSTVAAAGPVARALRGFSASTERAAALTLLNYGYRRVPGELAGVVLLSFPPILAAHFVDLDGVAFISAGLYVLAVMSIAFQPIGLVFLPLLSRLCKTDFEAARDYVRQLTTASIHIAAFATVQLVLFADIALRAWLGPAFDEAGTIIAITVCPAGVYVLNVILRSALDAAAVTAYNARNNVIALAVAGVCVTVSLATDLAAPLNCIAWSFAIGVMCFGLFTLVSVHRLFRLRVADYELLPALGLALLTAVLAVPVRSLVIGDDTSLGSIAVILGLELVLATVYVGGLVRAGVGWPRAVRAQLRGGA